MELVRFGNGFDRREESGAATNEAICNQSAHSCAQGGGSSTLLAAAASPSLSLSAEAEEGEFDIRGDITQEVYELSNSAASCSTGCPKDDSNCNVPLFSAIV